MQLQRQTRTITPQAQAWVWGLSRRSPKEFGYRADTWSVTLLAFHVRGYCRAAGHPTLARITYGTLSRLLEYRPERESAVD